MVVHIRVARLEGILCVCSVADSCPAPCDSMDCSPPGSSVHGIFQARILEKVAISYSRGSSCLLHRQTNSLPPSHSGSPKRDLQFSKLALLPVALPFFRNIFMHYCNFFHYKLSHVYLTRQLWGFKFFCFKKYWVFLQYR